MIHTRKSAYLTEIEADGSRWHAYLLSTPLLYSVKTVTGTNDKSDIEAHYYVQGASEEGKYRFSASNTNLEDGVAINIPNIYIYSSEDTSEESVPAFDFDLEADFNGDGAPVSLWSTFSDSFKNRHTNFHYAISYPYRYGRTENTAIHRDNVSITNMSLTLYKHYCTDIFDKLCSKYTMLTEDMLYEVASGDYLYNGNNITYNEEGSFYRPSTNLLYTGTSHSVAGRPFTLNSVAWHKIRSAINTKVLGVLTEQIQIKNNSAFDTDYDTGDIYIDYAKDAYGVPTKSEYDSKETKKAVWLNNAGADISNNIVLVYAGEITETTEDFIARLKSDDDFLRFYNAAKKAGAADTVAIDIAIATLFPVMPRSFSPTDSDSLNVMYTNNQQVTTTTIDNRTVQVRTNTNNILVAIDDTTGVPDSFVSGIGRYLTDYTFNINSVSVNSAQGISCMYASGELTLENMFSIATEKVDLNSYTPQSTDIMQQVSTNNKQLCMLTCTHTVYVAVNESAYQLAMSEIDKARKEACIVIYFGVDPAPVWLAYEEVKKNALAKIYYDTFLKQEFSIQLSPVPVYVNSSGLTPNLDFVATHSAGVLVGAYKLLLAEPATDVRQLQVYSSAESFNLFVDQIGQVLFKSSALSLDIRNSSATNESAVLQVTPTFTETLDFTVEDDNDDSAVEDDNDKSAVEDDNDKSTTYHIYSKSDMNAGIASDIDVLMYMSITADAPKQLVLQDFVTNLTVPSDTNTHIFFNYNLGAVYWISNVYDGFVYVAISFVQSDIDTASNNTVLLLKANVEKDSNYLHVLSVCNNADIAHIFSRRTGSVYSEPKPLSGLPSGLVIDFTSGTYNIPVPVITKDDTGNILHSDTYIFKMQPTGSWTLFNQRNSTAGESPVLELSTVIHYACQCVLPSLTINGQAETNYIVRNNIVTFTCNNYPATLRIDTGILEYLDDIFEFSTDNTFVQGAFEYMKYCTVSTILRGVYKISTADNTRYTVHSTGSADGYIDFTAEEIDE